MLSSYNITRSKDQKEIECDPLDVIFKFNNVQFVVCQVGRDFEVNFH